jgi:hypothetical protein
LYSIILRWEGKQSGQSKPSSIKDLQVFVEFGSKFAAYFSSQSFKGFERVMIKEVNMSKEREFP